jgi:hypothetical protein
MWNILRFFEIINNFMDSLFNSFIYLLFLPSMFNVFNWTHDYATFYVNLVLLN